jgi:hypothetical protein
MSGVVGVALLTIAFGWFISQAEKSNPGRANCQETRVLTEGSEVTIQGKVMGRVERPEGLKDQNFALKVLTADYGMVSVVYSAFRLCHNEVGASLKAGDKVEVYGKVISKNKITVCLSKTHYIKKL